MTSSWQKGFLVLMTLLASSQSFAENMKEIAVAEELVLSDRLIQIHNRQKDLAEKCSVKAPSIGKAMLAVSPKYIRPISADGSKRSKESLSEINLHLIDTVKKQYSVLKPCLETKLGAIMISPRKNINPLVLNGYLQLVCVGALNPIRCAIEVARMTNQVKPYCFKPERSGSGVFEDFACLAGDALLDKTLRPAYDKHRYGLLVAFSAILLQQTMAAKEGSSIDLYQTHKTAMTQPSSANFLATLAAVGSSGNSGLTGYLQGLEDRWLIEDISLNLPTNEVYSHYLELQKAKIFYQFARQFAEKKKIRLSVGVKDISRWNRHNMMAAYLGCSLSAKNSPALVQRYVSMIGAGYESRDFVSHLSRGNSWKSSSKNFDEDTRRYQQSVQAGISWCKPRK